MKKEITVTSSIFLLGVCFIIFGVATCQAPRLQHTYETDDTRFKNGEILMPDYVHTEKLMVVNADSLNWAMEYYDAASDGDIADILNAFCIALK